MPLTFSSGAFTAIAARRDFFFEGSVAGGIPIVGPLKESLAANRVQEVMGIVNGTTNYILTKMTREGAEFEEVLREAHMSAPTRVRRYLSRFIVVIVVALSTSRAAFSASSSTIS